MKILNLNIGMKINNSEAVAEMITHIDPHIVTLQEIVRHFDDSVDEMYKAYHQIKTMIKVNYPYEFFSPLFTSKKVIEGDETIDFGGLVEQGNVLFSKFPITRAENIFYYKNYCYQIKSENGEKIDEPRAIQYVHLKTPQGLVTILHTHGIWTQDKMGDERNDIAMDVWQSLIDKQNTPLILVGDLNVLPESKTIQTLNNKLINVNALKKLGHTRPKFEDGIDVGGNAVDYVFVNDKIRVHNLQILESNVSDHYPLVFDFETTHV